MGLLVGIDEVGRGCWAGPLVAGAVCLSVPIKGLNDSKVLSKLKREKLALEINQKAACGLGWVWPEEIDKVGLTVAVSLAMRAALGQITAGYDRIIVDGNYNYLNHGTGTLIGKNIECLIGADKLIQEVSAASIIAKVARDTYMARQAELFPGYNFETNVGYGTKLHISGLKQLGVSKIHRISYKPVKAFLL